MSSRTQNILVPVISIVLGLIVGAIVMLVSGYDPIAGYSALWNGIFGSTYNMGETVRTIIPYVFSGLAVAFAFRTGLFNIGVEGQLIMGWFAAAYVGFAFELPMIIHLPLAILAAAIVGALWAYIPGLLKARLGVHEVIVTIMMNYIALRSVNPLIDWVTGGEERTPKIQETASLRSDFLQSITDFSRMHWGFVIAIIGVIVMWFILEKTTRGYELKAVGFNRNASEYAGMNVKKNIVLSMVISGAFAGLAGAMEALGTFQNIATMSALPGIGFDGIAVALLGANQPVGVFFAAVLFGSLKNGGLNMPSAAGVPNEIVSIVIAVIILFAASGYVIRLLLNRAGKQKKEVK